MGLSVDEIVSGFPSWETLERKNIVDETYQDLTLRVMEDEELLIDEEW